MEFVEYINTKNRMRKYDIKNGVCMISCGDCPLGKSNNGIGIICLDLEDLYPEKAERIVEQWAEEQKEG